MTTTLKKRTVVIIGGGLASGFVSRHLVAEGYDVLVLEGGVDHRAEIAPTIPSQRDELRWAMRGGDLFQDRARKTYKFRHSLEETAPLARTLEAFVPGDGMGGAGNRWNGQMALVRMRPDAAIVSRVARRQEVDHGRDADPEPGRDVRRARASSRTVRGPVRRRRQGGQPRRQDPVQRQSVRSARKSEYPQEPLRATEAGLIVAAKAERLGYKPFPTLAGSSRNACTNPDDVTFGQRRVCGHCERLVCEANAKASPEVPLYPMPLAEANFEIRLGARVTGIDYDRRAKRVTGVRYVDRESGAGYLQPADIILLAAFTATSTRLLLL